MPWKPPTAAQRRPACRRDADRQYAARRVRDPSAGETLRVYRSRRWRQLALVHLAREPLCRTCREDGLVVAAVDVDHVAPLALRPDLAFDDSNLASRCRSCHNKKTAREATTRRSS